MSRSPRFLGFCSWLGVELTPGQAEFARVAYDGLEPVDRDLAVQIFGPDLPVGRRRVVAAVCGRRAGKSYVMVALRLVHGMLVRDVPPLPPGIKAVAMIIAPRSNMRDEVFAYALGAIESKPELRAMLVSTKAETFTLRRPDGKRVTFECGVATAGGTAARGRWFLDFALDECAFFPRQHVPVNDEELYKAGRSVLLPGGQILITSTPWRRRGSCTGCGRPGRTTRTWRMRRRSSRTTTTSRGRSLTRRRRKTRTQRRASSALAL